MKSSLFTKHTNQIAELNAMIIALSKVKDLISTNEITIDVFEYNKINIYSDSAYGINGITDWITGWRRNNWVTSKNEKVKNLEEWQKLLYLKELLEEQNCTINFIKVKGHSGNEYNEIVDKLAVEAREE